MLGVNSNGQPDRLNPNQQTDMEHLHTSRVVARCLGCKTESKADPQWGTVAPETVTFHCEHCDTVTKHSITVLPARKIDGLPTTMDELRNMMDCGISFRLGDKPVSMSDPLFEGDQRHPTWWDGSSGYHVRYHDLPNLSREPQTDPAKLGAAVAELLHLKPDRNQRYQTAWGTKSNEGLGSCILRLVDNPNYSET